MTIKEIDKAIEDIVEEELSMMDVTPSKKEIKETEQRIFERTHKLKSEKVKIITENVVKKWMDKYE